ncbi:MAG: NAD(P)-binding protein [Clostridia bacterium]|nr:NAD(P)-binding protein [Clostridia bacterium]
MKKYYYLIVGSGLFGAVFCKEALKYSKKCPIIKKREHTDGNIYCENIEGVPLHKYETHIFHESDKSVWAEGWYTACISTQDLCEFKYGYYEIICILPKSTGMWSAFWMMNGGVVKEDGSGKDGTEVDIFESMFYKDEVWDHGEAHVSVGLGKYYANTPYEKYNTYSVETCRTSADGASQPPEWLLVSYEVAEENDVANANRYVTGKISMKPEDTAEFIVGYVRVYQYKNAE